MTLRKILHIIFALLLISLDVFLIVEASMNGNASGSQSNSFSQVFIDLIRAIDYNSPLLSDIDTFRLVIRKLFGHFLAFGLSGILTVLTLSTVKDLIIKKNLFVIIFTLIKGLLLASITELIQYFIPGRSGNFVDIFIDYGGFLLFASIIYIIVYFVLKNKSINEPEKE